MFQERRAKFRQDLIGQGPTKAHPHETHDTEHHHRPRRKTLSPNDIHLPLKIDEHEDRSRRLDRDSISDIDPKEQRNQRYRPRSRSPYRPSLDQSHRSRSPNPDVSVHDFAAKSDSAPSQLSFKLFGDDEEEDEDEKVQDINEVWFSGGHGMYSDSVYLCQG
jgi:hypothetical protein